MFDLIYNVVNYNRTNIAIESISKLILQQQKYTLIDVIDDCSTENINVLKIILNEPPFFDTQKRLTINPKNMGVEYNNICRLNDEVYNNQEFVYLTDNDVTYSKSFYLELQKLKNFMQEHTNVLAGTLFNYNTSTSCHFVLGYYNDEYAIKNSFGGISMLIRVKDFREAMDYYLSDEYNGVQGWDWAVCDYAKQQNKILIATKNSFVQHIGEIGINSQPSRFDYANNFLS